MVRVEDARTDLDRSFCGVFAASTSQRVYNLQPMQYKQ
jgi:hypothetical protein